MATVGIGTAEVGALAGAGVGVGGEIYMMSTGGMGGGPGSTSQGGRPRTGQEVGRGAEGVVYENLDQPGTVVKVFQKGATSPLQAGNVFQNLEKARAVHPDNVVKAQAPADPRQGWIVKEQVIRDPPPADLTERAPILQDFDNAGVQDARGNLIFGHTASNPTPRWLLIE